MHSLACAISRKRRKAFVVAEIDFGSPVFSLAIFFVRILCKNGLPFKNVGDHFFPKQPKKHSSTRTSLTAYVCPEVDVWQHREIYFLYASCKRGGAFKAGMELKFPFLCASISASSLSTTFCNKAALISEP